MNKTEQLLEQIQIYVKAYVASELELQDAIDRNTSEDYIENLEDLVEMSLDSIQLITKGLINKK